MLCVVFQSTITALQLNVAAGMSLNKKQGQQLQNYPGRNADAKSSFFALGSHTATAPAGNLLEACKQGIHQ